VPPTAGSDRVVAGECTEGFESLAPKLAAVEQHRRVRESDWRVFPASEVVELAAR
jgi:hypothetical protein